MSEHTIQFKSVEDASIAIINRFFEMIPQAEKWNIDEQSKAISDLTNRLLVPGNIVCILHDEDVAPKIVVVTTISSTD